MTNPFYRPSKISPPASTSGLLYLLHCVKMRAGQLGAGLSGLRAASEPGLIIPEDWMKVVLDAARSDNNRSKGNIRLAVKNGSGAISIAFAQVLT